MESYDIEQRRGEYNAERNSLEESGSIKKQLMLAIVIIGRIFDVVFGYGFPEPRLHKATATSFVPSSTALQHI